MYRPRGMSNALRESVAADVRAVVQAYPIIASRLASTGQVVDIRGPAEFAACIQEILDQLASIAQALPVGTIGLRWQAVLVRRPHRP